MPSRKGISGTVKIAHLRIGASSMCHAYLVFACKGVAVLFYINPYLALNYHNREFAKDGGLVTSRV